MITIDITTLTVQRVKYTNEVELIDAFARNKLNNLNAVVELISNSH